MQKKDLKKERSVWQRRTNSELTDLYGEPMEFVRQQRVRWPGHVQRMENRKATKMVININLPGGRAKGRPRSRWEEGDSTPGKAWSEGLENHWTDFGKC